MCFRTQRFLTLGGRRRIFTAEQETVVTQLFSSPTMLLNSGTLLADNITFRNVESVSITTIARVLKKHQIRMKQLYTVAFERNSDCGGAQIPIPPGKMTLLVLSLVGLVRYNVI